ncbi:cell wall-associated NlpC family hydrolase [Nonomuraea polychroma]|uniref:Cell wall-associated NlpC family hydrolase n=1 Tax=Nonomuraea polychroma TaxID=46176 RepID=A0A438MGX0_9ACTN|nr:NlpC/P60 family protein [Nonomuraea polychroma]RVX44818.1 cell wall-associated NlpC family hydrolase [Nonomuraea polychroma]
MTNRLALLSLTFTGGLFVTFAAIPTTAVRAAALPTPAATPSKDAQPALWGPGLRLEPRTWPLTALPPMWPMHAAPATWPLAALPLAEAQTALPGTAPQSAFPTAGPRIAPPTTAAQSPFLQKPKRKTTKGQIAASAALDQLGVSFSWGGGSAKGPTLGIGRGAHTRGFDCSGLTLYAWAQAGVTLSHYTGAQFRQGRRIAPGSRRVGDLLFFGGGTGDPTHVALYLGRGIMIHAPKTGDVVKKTNFLRSPYYRATFRGTVRPG